MVRYHVAVHIPIPRFAVGSAEQRRGSNSCTDDWRGLAPEPLSRRFRVDRLFLRVTASYRSRLLVQVV